MTALQQVSSLRLGFLSTSLGYRLKRAYLRIHDDFVEAAAELDLRPQLFSVLCLVIENPGCIQSEAARTLSIERSNIVAFVDELVRRGLITRNAVAGDRRLAALHATAAGQRLFKTAVGRLAGHEERAMQDLSLDERAILMRLLDRVGATAAEVRVPTDERRPTGRRRAYG